MVWLQETINLDPKSEGMYLIDNEIKHKFPQIRNVKVGLLHLFIKHTSAGLCINENYDPDVRTDMMGAVDRMFPVSDVYLHQDEGPDDMPSHLKSVFVGNSVTIPIKNGQFNVGTWQGVYLCEFRKAPHSRRVVATLNGE